MNILLTGYKGFIGSNMLKALVGHNVTTYEWNEQLPNIKGYDWVIHMGAISSTTERNIEKVLCQNLDFSIDLLDKCIKNNVNFQFSSSASVYGNRENNFVETINPDPRNPYAWSKYLFERHIEKLDTIIKNKILIQVFRYFNVYGPGEDHKNDMASPYHKFAKQFKETGKIRLFKNSENYFRDFVPVDYVCKTHVDFFDVKESGVFNIGTGKIKSFLEVALELAPNNAIEYISMPDNIKDSYQTYTCADMTKTLAAITKYKGEKNE